MRRKTFLAASLLSLGICLSAQNSFYVAPSGDDNAIGSKEMPVRSVNTALELARKTTGSDTVYINIASGTYLLTESLKVTEKDSRPIVFQGDANNKPVMSGAIEIKGWEVTPEGWWKCRVPEAVHYGARFEQLYVNGKRATLARTPDEGYLVIANTTEAVHYRGNGRFAKYATQTFTAQPADVKVLEDITKEEDSDAYVTFFHKWNMTRRPLFFAEPDSAIFSIAGAGMAPWNKIDKGKRYYMSNYKGALTQPGEWFLDKSGELYYIPKAGEDPKTATCFAPMLTQLLEIKGTYDNKVEGKVFRNICFDHTANYMPHLGHNPAQAAAPIDAAVQLDFAKNISFYNCEIKHTGNYAMWFRRGVENSEVRHSYLYDMGAGGIKIGEVQKEADQNLVTKHITVDNNIILHAGLIFPQAVGVVIFNASDNKVTHNEISDLYYTGVSVGWTWGYDTENNSAVRNEIAYNHISYIGWGLLSDMGAVYTLGVSPGTTIHHNVIHDVYSYDYGGWGLYTDEGSSHIVMENNLVYGCKSGGFHQHFGLDNTIRNNIFAYSTTPQMKVTKVKQPQGLTFEQNIIYTDHGEMLEGMVDADGINIDRNCYWHANDKNPKFLDKTFAEWQKDAKKDRRSIIADPMFRDPLNGDYTITNKKAIKKIGFKPFDYSKVGVYGDKEWIEQAKVSEDRKQLFKQIVNEREKTNTSYHNK